MPTPAAQTRELRLTQGASGDLVAIHQYLQQQAGDEAADRWLDDLLALASSLGSNPERGATPAELRGMGMNEFRQLWLRPYRLVYQVTPAMVVVHLVVDGRRDVQDLLVERLLRS